MEVKASTLPRHLKAGNGLFALKDFAKGDVVATYDYDDVIDDEELVRLKVRKDKQVKYVLQLKKNKHLCGLMEAKTGRGMGSLINSGGKAFKNNCRFSRFRKEIKIKCSVRLIKKGTELFVPYNRGKLD